MTIEARLANLDSLTAYPYTIYRDLRDEAPVHWSDVHDAWLISRYTDVRWALEAKQILSSANRETLPESGDEAWEAFSGFTGFFWSDPPEYTSHRRRWSKAFKSRIHGIGSLVSR